MSSQLTLYRRPSTKHTLIVMYLGHSVKDYRENFLYQLDILQLLCPACHQAHTLIMHGSYWRNLLWEKSQERIPILRVLCGKCTKTHAILPDFVAPYRKYAMPVIELTVMEVLDQKIAIEKAEGIQDVSTTKRWFRRLRSSWNEICGALRSISSRLTDTYQSFGDGEYSTYRKTLQDILEHLPPVPCTSFLGGSNIFLTADQTQVWV